MKLNIAPVETTHIQQVWPKVVGFIKSAMDKGTTEETRNYNEHHIQSFLSDGKWLLVVAVDENNEIHGACTISFISYPLHRVAFITTIGGRLISNRETFGQLKELCKHYGATKIQGYGRESIVKLWGRYDFEPVSTLVEIKI
jgi:hypothetical protein